MEPIQIHVCTPEDAATLSLLVAALAREEGTIPAQPEAMTSTIRTLIATAASDFLLVHADGQPAGCLQIAWRPSTWHGVPYAYLEDVFVVPEWRGRGIGSRLLGEARTRAETRGAAQIMLDVRADNRMARRLYERLGFVDSGSVLMKRAIAEP